RRGTDENRALHAGRGDPASRDPDPTLHPRGGLQAVGSARGTQLRAPLCGTRCNTVDAGDAAAQARGDLSALRRNEGRIKTAGTGAMLVDSHCHLDFPDFATERAAIIARARAAGVETMLTIGTRLDEFPGVRSIAEAHEEVWCSVGAHPHEAKDHTALVPEELIALAAHPKVVGIGETGLDFHYDLSP